MEGTSMFLQELEEEQLNNSTLSTQEPEEANSPSGFIDTAIDIGKGILSGPVKEVENLVQTGRDIVNYVDDKFLGDQYVDNDVDYDFVPESITPKGGAGKTAQAITAFAAGWFSVGTKIKAATSGAKVFQAMPKIAPFVSTAVAGGVTDFITGDGTDSRLADVLLDNDIMGNAVVEYLSSDADDSALEGRLKNTIEGFILGSALDGAMALFKSMRRTYKAGVSEGLSGSLKAHAAETTEAYTKIAKEATAQTDEVAGMTMTTEASIASSRKKAAAETVENPVFNYNKFSEPIRKDFMDLNKPIYDVVKGDTMSMTDLAGDTVDAVSRMTGDVFGKMDMLQEAMQKGTREASEIAQTVAKSTYACDSIVIPEQIKALKAVADGSDGAEEYLRTTTTRVIEWAIELKKLYRAAGRIVKSADVLAFIGREDADGAIRAVLDNPTTAAKEITDKLSLTELRQLGTNIASVHKTGGNIMVPILGALPEGHGLRKAVVNKDPAWWRVLKTFRYNSMLSSIRGRIRDGVSMTTKSIVMPFEKTVSGAVEGFMNEGLGGVAQGAGRGKYYAQGMFQSLSNAWEMSKISYKNGTSILRGGNLLRESMDSPDALRQLTGVNALGNDRLAGKMITAPTRLMAAMDEFFGQMHYYAESYERIMRGINETKIAAAITDTAEYRKFVDDYVKENMDKIYRDVVLANGQTYKAGAVFKEGLAAANEATYQMPLGDVGRKFHTAINSNKATQFLFPFFKTPTNLFKDALWIRTPYGGLKHMRDAWKAGDHQAMGVAAGHLATGITLWGATYGLFTSGKLTGAGPTDKAAKAALYENGWQPYSIKIGDNYVPINAFEPFSTGMSVMADAMEICEQTDGVGAEEVGSAMLGAVMEFAKNRTYLQGLANIMDAMSRDTGKGSALLTNSLTSFFPTAFRDVAQAVDPAIREARGVIEQFQAKTLPQLSELSPKYNWLTGHPQIYGHGGGLGVFSPIVKSDDAMDIVFGELGKSRGISQPRRKIGNVELNSAEFSEYSQLHGSVKIGGKTMYEALRAVIMSPQYDAARLRSFDPNPRELDEGRTAALGKVVQAYRKRAQSEMLRIYPHLRQQGSGGSINTFGAKSNPFGSITGF